MHRRQLIQFFSDNTVSTNSGSSTSRQTQEEEETTRQLQEEQSYPQRTIQKSVSSMKSYSSLLLLLSCYCVVIGMSSAFMAKLPQQRVVVATSTRTKSRVNNDKNGNNNNNSNGGGGFPNPIQEFADMFSNLDDVIDDFFNKRMGNGEIFYGKRKYKPSGEVDGDYNGFGLSDKQRIDDTREWKAYRMEEMMKRKEEQEQQQK